MRRRVLALALLALFVAGCGHPDAASRAPGRQLLVQSAPAAAAAAAPGPTALCRDGTYSYARHHGGACSWHGGVARWLR